MSARAIVHAAFVRLRVHPFEAVALIGLLWVLWLIVGAVQLGIADQVAARIFRGAVR